MPGAYGGGVVALDLTTQAVSYITTDDMIALAERHLEEIAAQRVMLPVEAPMGQNMQFPTEWSKEIEWLQENVGDDWGRYTKAVTDDDQGPLRKRFFYSNRKAGR